MAIRDVDVCEPWQMHAILATLRCALDSDETVYLHCWGGVGRTGTAVGCRLVESAQHDGASALEEIARLRQHTQRAHRTSPETDAQRAVVLGWTPRGQS